MRFHRSVDFVLYLLTVIVIAFTIRTFLFEPIRVKGQSMTPTLENGEILFVEKWSYWQRAPRRGEIVICFYPGYTESCVKRVIGLPGEELTIQDGAVYINGEKLDETDYYAGLMHSNDLSMTVGAEEVFVMGDNRNGSKDSRNPAVGPIPYSKILGRVRAVVFPFWKGRGGF